MIDNNEGRSAPETASAKVSIVIPCRAEYVAIARLATLGIANRLAFSYDEVEDMRLAVGEACTHAVERAMQVNLLSDDDLNIWIESSISPTELAIEVRDNVPATEASAVQNAGIDDDLDIDKQDLGALLMEILVDEVETVQKPDGTTIRLVKRTPQNASNSGR